MEPARRAGSETHSGLTQRRKAISVNLNSSFDDFRMRLLAIGDIHGCATALRTLLDEVNPQAGDTVITLGDYINKGPDSKTTVDILVQLFKQGLLIPLLGNHELKLLTARKKNRAKVGSKILVDQQTLSSYGNGQSRLGLDSIPEEHWNFLEQHCRKWVETEEYIFVHATLDPDKLLPNQSEQVLFWNKLNHPKPHISGKVVVCGHTPQRSGNPLNLGHTICLDTAASRGQWLTCLDLYSGQIWQANQLGKIRFSNIEDYLFQPLHCRHLKNWISFITLNSTDLKNSMAAGKYR